MRELKSKKFSSPSDPLRVDVLDEPGSDGSSHAYGIASQEFLGAGATPAVMMTIQFQNGSVQQFGMNGVTDLAVLAVLEDRLDDLQNGPNASVTNAQALEHLREAMLLLSEPSTERTYR